MTKNQAIIVALAGAAYLVAAFHCEGYAQTLFAFVSGLHICAAFIIKE